MPVKVLTCETVATIGTPRGKGKSSTRERNPYITLDKVRRITFQFPSADLPLTLPLAGVLDIDGPERSLLQNDNGGGSAAGAASGGGTGAASAAGAGGAAAAAAASGRNTGASAAAAAASRNGMRPIVSRRASLASL